MSYKLPSCTCLLLIHNNQVLLIKRQNTGRMDGMWSIPGGAVEENESLAQSVIREMQEEVNVEVAPADIKLVHVMYIRGQNPTLGFYFAATRWSGDIKNNEPHKHSEVAWFSINDVPSTITLYSRQALDGYQTGSTYSESHW